MRYMVLCSSSKIQFTQCDSNSDAELRREFSVIIETKDEEKEITPACNDNPV